MEIGVLFEKFKNRSISGKVTLISKEIDGVIHYGLFTKNDINVEYAENLTEEEKNYILDNFVNNGWWLKEDGVNATFEWYLPNEEKTGKNRQKYLMVILMANLNMSIYADYNNTGEFILDAPGDQESANICYEMIKSCDNQEVTIQIGVCQYTDKVPFTGN